VSQENVEVVREAIDLVTRASRGDQRPRLFDLLSPDLEIDMSRRVFNPDIYRGHAGLRRLFQETQEVWEEFSVVPERFIDAGERAVVIETLRGRGRTSGLEIENRSAVIWTVQEGQVIRMEMGLDPEEALASVRLAE
jgi:ketosteroid isomerase-like protein